MSDTLRGPETSKVSLRFYRSDRKLFKFYTNKHKILKNPIHTFFLLHFGLNVRGKHLCFSPSLSLSLSLSLSFSLSLSLSLSLQCFCPAESAKYLFQTPTQKTHSVSKSRKERVRVRELLIVYELTTNSCSGGVSAQHNA